MHSRRKSAADLVNMSGFQVCTKFVFLRAQAHFARNLCILMTTSFLVGRQHVVAALVGKGLAETKTKEPYFCLHAF
jgi:hypothetical protein